MESRSPLGEIDGSKMAEAKAEPGGARARSHVGTRIAKTPDHHIIYLFGFSGLAFRGDPCAEKIRTDGGFP